MTNQLTQGDTYLRTDTENISTNINAITTTQPGFKITSSSGTRYLFSGVEGANKSNILITENDLIYSPHLWSGLQSFDNVSVSNNISVGSTVTGFDLGKGFKENTNGIKSKQSLNIDSSNGNIILS